MTRSTIYRGTKDVSYGNRGTTDAFYDRGTSVALLSQLLNL